MTDHRLLIGEHVVNLFSLVVSIVSNLWLQQNKQIKECKVLLCVVKGEGLAAGAWLQFEGKKIKKKTQT